MVIRLIKQKNGRVYDLTGGAISCSWEGSVDSVARSFKLGMIHGPYDDTIKLPQIENGDFLDVWEDGTKRNETGTLVTSLNNIFYGQIYSLSRTGTAGEIMYQAYEISQKLTGHIRYSAENKTAEAVAAEVLEKYQIPHGKLEPTGVVISSMICEDNSIYEVISHAYTQARKMTGIPYMIRVVDRKIEVTKKGWVIAHFYLSEAINILSSSMEETQGELVNLVRIYDETGMQTGEVRDEPSIAEYGERAVVYVQEDGIDPVTGAAALLKTRPEQTLQVEALGDICAVAGNGIEIYDEPTGLSGRYWIQEDSHSWSGGKHTMDLKLKFVNLMAETEIR